MKECNDHLGNVFPSVKAMCDAHGVMKNTYYQRLNRGFTEEQALQPDKVLRKYGKIDGIAMSEFSRKKHIGVPQVKRYLNGKITREELLINCHSKKTMEERTDINGKVYPSVRQMAMAWKISYDVYRLRMREGWTKERALTTPVRPRNHRTP